MRVGMGGYVGVTFLNDILSSAVDRIHLSCEEPSAYCTEISSPKTRLSRLFGTLSSFDSLANVKRLFTNPAKLPFIDLPLSVELKNVEVQLYFVTSLYVCDTSFP